MTKTCDKHGTELTRFTDGRMRCRACSRDRQKAYYHRKIKETDGAWASRYTRTPEQQAASKYGITESEVRALRGRGRCDVCESTEGLSIDHSHESGQVRGLLCRGCNVTLGHVGDSIDRLTGLIRYLERCDPDHTS